VGRQVAILQDLPGPKLRIGPLREDVVELTPGERLTFSCGDGDRAGDAELLGHPAGEVGGKANPNGSMNDIAGIYNETFNVLGMMPHLENLIDPLVGGVDGRGMFEGLSAA